MKLRDKPSIRDMVYNKYGGRCAYCGCELSRDLFHIDHIDAKFRGSSDREIERYGRIRGKDVIMNFNPSCISCNSSKSTLTIEKWRAEIALKIKRINRDVSGYRLLRRFNLIKETNNPVIFYFEKYHNE